MLTTSAPNGPVSENPRCLLLALKRVIQTHRVETGQDGGGYVTQPSTPCRNPVHMLGANCHHFKNLLVPQVLLVMSSLFLFQRSEANEGAYSFFKHGRLSQQGEG